MFAVEPTQFGGRSVFEGIPMVLVWGCTALLRVSVQLQLVLGWLVLLVPMVPSSRMTPVLPV